MLKKVASITIFLSLWYDSTWDWTQVSPAIEEHYEQTNEFLARLKFFSYKQFIYKLQITEIDIK